MHGRGCFVTHEAFFIGKLLVPSHDLRQGVLNIDEWSNDRRILSSNAMKNARQWRRRRRLPSWWLPRLSASPDLQQSRSHAHFLISAMGDSLSIYIKQGTHPSAFMWIFSTSFYRSLRTIKMKRGVRANVPARSLLLPTCWFDNIRLY